MGKINVLDKHLAELIAAGEVVTRPSSVIKELVENSIDSGATSVTVEIENGGITFMRVTDNGGGILRDDIRNAFKRHATSKVKLKEDLDAIGTLGFRGEALASISAVARVELITKAPEEEVGTRYVIEGGDEVSLEDAGCPNGTTFIVRDIFYNTPARMKYMKKNTTEASSIGAVVDKAALSHSEIAFSFIRDHKQILVTAGDGSEKNCIYAVLGREFSTNSVEVDYELDGITVKGYVTKPQASRGSRGMQNFFINDRFVKSRTAMAALEEACKGMVMVGKFPGCVLHIGVPYNNVDVNVHPSKIEVRFANERPIFEAVYHGVRSALLAGDTVKPFKMDQIVDKSVVQKPFTMSQHEVKKLERTPFVRPSNQPDKKTLGVYSSLLENSVGKYKSDMAENDSGSKSVRLSDSAPSLFGGSGRTSVFIPEVGFRRNPGLNIPIDEDSAYGNIKSGNERIDEEAEPVFGENLGDEEENTESAFPAAEDVNGVSEESDDEVIEKNDRSGGDEEEIETLTDVKGEGFRFIGEAFMTYIIIEKSSEIVLIDKHALHERIIYERLRKEQGKKYAQYLLSPVTVSLSGEQHRAVLEKKELFFESGFEVEEFGRNTLIVRSAPSFIDAADAAATIEEMADHILENKSNIESEYTDWLYHNIACRSAVKGGDKSSPEELIELYIELGEDPNYRYCPHGRPTSISLSKYQIEKQFGRV